jgi:hypothetical protein
MDATNNTLDCYQVSNFSISLANDLKKELLEAGHNKYEMNAFIEQVVRPKIRAILCTLNNAAYEDIVKAVYDKLNLNDLFDNRHKYLN